MPIHAGYDQNGWYYQWGDHGKKYYYQHGDDVSKYQAYQSSLKQAQAAYAHGYRKK